jgi:hypothetical protein
MGWVVVKNPRTPETLKRWIPVPLEINISDNNKAPICCACYVPGQNENPPKLTLDTYSNIPYVI